MSIFGEQATTVSESPATGQEEQAAAATENEQVINNEQQANEELASEQLEVTEESESSPDQGQGEELILGKFKNNEELAKAYSELQKQFTQTRMQPSQQSQQTQQPAPEESTDYNQVFWDSFRDNPLGTMQFLVDNVVNQKTAPIYEQREQETLGKNIDAISKEYKQVTTEEGMTAMFQKIGEIAQDLGNPKLANNPSPRVLKMAALELWGDSNGQMYKKAEEKGRQAAEEARKAKLGIQSIAVTKKPNETPRTEMDEIRDNIRAAGQRYGLFG